MTRPTPPGKLTPGHVRDSTCTISPTEKVARSSAVSGGPAAATGGGVTRRREPSRVGGFCTGGACGGLFSVAWGAADAVEESLPLGSSCAAAELKLVRAGEFCARGVCGGLFRVDWGAVVAVGSLLLLGSSCTAAELTLVRSKVVGGVEALVAIGLLSSVASVRSYKQLS